MGDKGLRQTEFLHHMGDGFLSIAHALQNAQTIFIGKALGQERHDLEVLGCERGFAGGFNRT